MKREPESLRPVPGWGRWRDDEHERFLKGIQLYGRNWVKVAMFVKTRTSTQVRSHAQKHDMKQGDAFDPSLVCRLGVDKATQYGCGISF